MSEFLRCGLVGEKIDWAMERDESVSGNLVGLWGRVGEKGEVKASNGTKVEITREEGEGRHYRFKLGNKGKALRAYLVLGEGMEEVGEKEALEGFVGANGKLGTEGEKSIEELRRLRPLIAEKDLMAANETAEEALREVSWGLAQSIDKREKED